MHKFYYCRCGDCFSERRFLREHISLSNDEHEEITLSEWWAKRNEMMRKGTWAPRME